VAAAQDAILVKLVENISNDNAVSADRIRYFLRLRTLATSDIFWLLFFAADRIDWINTEQL